MIQGIGVDIVRVERFVPWLGDKKKLGRYFHPREIQTCLLHYSPEQSFAARYAAREAFSKALGTGLRNVRLNELRVEQDEAGKPHLHITDDLEKILKARGADHVHVSLSHEKDYAVAVVVIE
ncbi:MAG: holo-ACP synthase [Salinispira sp.]